jgi:hypothetical protein
MTKIAVNQKISHIFDYERARLIENIKSSELDVEVGVSMFDRNGERHGFIKSQRDILRRVINPHSNEYAGVKYFHYDLRIMDNNDINVVTPQSEDDMMAYIDSRTNEQLLSIPAGTNVVDGINRSSCIDGEVQYEGVYPICKILNLPTGCGKTCISVCGMLQCMQSSTTQQKLMTDYSLFIERCSVGRRGGSCASLIRQKSIFLPNAILVYAPQHLVGVWRDTFRANVGNDVEVFPKTDGLVMRGFDYAEIRRNPNKTYVYVVNTNSVKKFISDEATGGEYTYGAVIVDEAETCSIVMKDSHEHLPLGMYTLLVTATPHGIASSLENARPHQFLYKMFEHQAIEMRKISNVFAKGFKIFSESPKERMNIVNYMADISGMHVIPRSLYSTLVNEIQACVPKMNSYKIPCTSSLPRLLGLVRNDMQNAANAIEVEEKRLGVRFRGSSTDDIVKQIDARLRVLEREYSAYNQELASLVQHSRQYNEKIEIIKKLQSSIGRLRFVRNKISSEFTKSCGLCFKEDADLAEGEEWKLYLTTCCAFGICKDCVTQLRTRSCPMCRCENTMFAMLDESMNQQRSTTNAVVAPVVAPVRQRIPKNLAGFETWLSMNQFSRVSQAIACDTILSKASEYGLTHVIIAGAYVDTWNILKHDVTKLYAFDVIRPYEFNVSSVTTDAGETVEQVRKKRKTVGKVDSVYKKFCSDSDVPQVLVLDMFINKSAEVAGIDAKFTDLIIQIDTSETASDAPCNIQLAGRALRLGRDPSVCPVRVVLGC